MTGIVGTATAAVIVSCMAVMPASRAEAFMGELMGGDDRMMTQAAPMLTMMKARMGKQRYGQLIRTMGPMMANMMDGGGFGGGGMAGFGGMGGYGGYGSTGGFDASDMMGMMNAFGGMGSWRGLTSGGRAYRRTRR